MMENQPNTAWRIVGVRTGMRVFFALMLLFLNCFFFKIIYVCWCVFMFSKTVLILNYRGEKGYLIMSAAWFKEFVFEIVVDKSIVPPEVMDVFQQTPIVLPGKIVLLITSSF